MLISHGKFIKTLIAVVLAAFLTWTPGCSNSTDNVNANTNTANQNTAAGNTNQVKDDAEELQGIIKLPETPEESVWREEENADPKGKKLTAVLKYAPEAAAKIVASADKSKPAAPTELGTESWFPEELTAQSQLSGDESIKATAYSANDFYNGPYKNGRIARVNDTDYFVLELTTY